MPGVSHVMLHAVVLQKKYNQKMVSIIVIITYDNLINGRSAIKTTYRFFFPFLLPIKKCSL